MIVFKGIQVHKKRWDRVPKNQPVKGNKISTKIAGKIFNNDQFQSSDFILILIRSGELLMMAELVKILFILTGVG